jgi:hypothetical protein
VNLRRLLGYDWPKRGQSIIALDFDGVLHGYQSGWKGATVIPDPPVAGAIGGLLTLMQDFDICIYSARSSQWGGRRAMRAWLRQHLQEWLDHHYEPFPRVIPYFHPGMDPWDEEKRYWAETVLERLHFPIFKPPAHLTIDDRAMCFDGDWHALDVAALAEFKPWNKRP